MNGLLVSVNSMASIVDNIDANICFNPFFPLPNGRCESKQNKTYVINFYQSCYAYHSICIEWIWALLQLLFDTRNDSMRSLVEKKK